MTTTNANDDNTATFLADMMIRMITEDPTKMIDALNDADLMIANGAADEDQSQHSLMAEAIMYMFKDANAATIENLDAMMTLYDDDIHALIVAHLDTIQK